MASDPQVFFGDTSVDELQLDPVRLNKTTSISTGARYEDRSEQGVIYRSPKRIPSGTSWLAYLVG